MSVEVDFVTLGIASKKLDVPAPTLRLWTDDLENYEVHYVKRNDRDERMYYDTDLEIFDYMRALKKEHGRKIQTKEAVQMIYQLATEKKKFVLRSREDAPKSEPSHTTFELLNNDDIRKMLESDRVSQLLGYMISEATKNIKEDLIEEVRNTVREEMLESKTHIQRILEQAEDSRVKKEEERLARVEESFRLREEKSAKMIAELREKQEAQEEEKASQPKSFWSKFLGI